MIHRLLNFCSPQNIAICAEKFGFSNNIRHQLLNMSSITAGQEIFVVFCFWDL